MKIVSLFNRGNKTISIFGIKLGYFSLVINIFAYGLFTIPFFINPGVFDTFEQTYLFPRLWLIFCVVTPIALLLLGSWDETKLNIPMLCLLYPFLLWLGISVLINRAGWPGWWGQSDRADGFLMHCIYALLMLVGWQWRKSNSDWRSKLTLPLLLIGSLVALGNILQQLHLLGVPNQNAFSGVIATPFGGTLGQRGYLGGYMALLLPVTLWLRQSLKGKSYLWASVAVALIAWALIGSFSRGPWLAGLMGGAAYLFWSRPPLKSLWPLAVAFLLFWPTTVIFGNARSLSLDGENGQAISDGSGRKVLWTSALLGIKEKPLFGWGTPALLKVMNTRDDAQLLKENGIEDVRTETKINMGSDSLPRFRVVHNNGKVETLALGGGVDKVHNEYLDYALTYGIPAALIFISLLGWSIWSGRLVAPGLSAGLVAYAVYLLTWPEVVRFAPIAWFFMGLALGSASLQRQRK